MSDPYTNNKPLHCAVACFSGSLGGLELALLRRGAELQAHGHRVVAIVPDAPAIVRQAEMLGLAVDCITPTLSYLDLPAARKISAVFDRERVDVAVVGRTRDLSTVMLAAGRDIAVVLFQQMQSGLNKRDWFHNRVYSRLDGCVTITERGREEMVTTTVLAPEKISVVPAGLDMARYAPDAVPRADARARYELPENAFVVGMVGRFDRGKGQPEFLRALGIAAAKEDGLAADLHAIVVGQREGDDAAYLAELDGLRDALPFADRVRLHPFSDDPRYAFRALDVFVLASHCETFGMVLQEAMALAVPVIGTDAGGVPEIVTHDLNGLLVPPQNVEAIADAIVTLYRDAELRGKLVEAARASAVNRYEKETLYARFELAVRDAIARRGG
ncbi:MAG TPA: glycosyltransferase family 4 protein [Candidatus Kapabacteria bacterium]|nr:glycosyltransferase family 4 protein [Candidatus Kapabacteria bacterium]